MGVDMDAIVDLFLKGTALQDTICILCNHRDMFCSDPITDTVSLMISQPISMAIGEGGLMLFGRRPDMTIPFTCMSREQLQYVGGIADELIVSINTSGEGVHMCGGVVVIPCKKKSNVRLNADEVVRALVACVRRKNDMCVFLPHFHCPVLFIVLIMRHDADARDSPRLPSTRR